MTALRRCSLAALGVLALSASSFIVASSTSVGTAGASAAAEASITAARPPGAAADPQESLSDISCVSLATCVAVGTYTTAASDPSNTAPGYPSPLEVSLANGTWSAFGLALPSNANLSTPNSALNSISCASTTSCVAVGQYSLSAGGQDPLIETLSAGGLWTAQNAPLPAGASDPTLESVSCPAVGSCVAVGSMGNSAVASGATPFVETLSGGTWTFSIPSLPSDAYTESGTTDTVASLFGVACPATGLCVAVGSYNLTATTTAPLVEGLSSGTWAPQFAPSPATTTTGSPTTSSAVFRTVACPSTSACVAGGSFSDSIGSANTFLDSLTSGTWSLYTASSVTGAALTGISCGAVGSCVATGNPASAVAIPGGGAIVTETLQSGAWTQSTVAIPAQGTDPRLGGISCVTTNACAVVGSYQASNGEQGFIDTGVNQGSTGTGTGTGNGVSPNGQAVGIAATPDGQGYWIATSTGVVEAFGDATSYGDLLGTTLNKPIVAITATPDGKGYWLLGADGGVFTFGDAGFYGSTGSLHLNKPVVGMAATADGRGYWFVAADGGVFAYGDAVFQGSTGAMHLNKPVVGMAADPVTGGYWLVGADGGIFSFNAPYDGSTGGLKLNAPIVGMEAAANGTGYRFVASDGGIFTFGPSYQGSEAQGQVPAPIVGMAATGTNGYWLVDQLGDVYSFGGAGYYGGGL